MSGSAILASAAAFSSVLASVAASVAVAAVAGAELDEEAGAAAMAGADDVALEEDMELIREGRSEEGEA